MCVKKGNPNFVKVGGRYYHRDVFFPVKINHSGTDSEPDAEFVEHDYYAEHGMYSQSFLHSMTGEPECFALDAHVQNLCAWEDHFDSHLDAVDASGDPLDALIAAEDAYDFGYYFDPVYDNAQLPDGDQIPIGFGSMLRMPMSERHVPECWIRRYNKRQHRGSWKSRVRKYGKHDRTTIRGAMVKEEISADIFGTIFHVELIAIPRVLR